MDGHVKHLRDLRLLHFVGLSLFRRILKVRDRLKERMQLSACRTMPWYAEKDGTVIGYEAGWPSVHSHPDH